MVFVLSNILIFIIFVGLIIITLMLITLGVTYLAYQIKKLWDNFQWNKKFK